ncbi:MAG: ROK family protein, partial [Chitinophaga rupis]
GLGACYIEKGRLAQEGKGVPPHGYLYNFPFLDATAEDYISARWLIRRFKEGTGKEAKDVREIAEMATAPAHSLFQEFGANLGRFIGSRLRDFNADCLVIGGSISHSTELFQDSLKTALNAEGITSTVYFSEGTELIAMAGAATLMDQQPSSQPGASSARTLPPPASETPASELSLSETLRAPARRTTQPQLPLTVATGAAPETGYRIFPYESLGSGHIHNGYDSLAFWMIKKSTVRIDGYAGLDWDHLRLRLSAEFRAAGIKTLWYETKAFLKGENEIDQLVTPFLGT